MSNKNIDHLFQEKLKSFEELPDESVWSSIEASLDKKKKKRVLPIWWKLGGVAAVVAILLFSLNPFDFDSNNSNSVTDIERPEEIDTPTNEISPATIEAGKEEGLTNNNNNTDNPHEGSKITNLNSSTATPVSIAHQKKKVKEQMKEAQGNANTLLAQGKPDTPVKTANAIDSENANLDVSPKEGNTAIASTIEQAKDANAVHPNLPTLQKQPFENEATQTEDGIAEITEDKKIAEKDKKSIFDAIAEEEEEIIVETNAKKWAISPAVAPIYFDSFGDGSPIDPSFSPNSKSGNVNLSYGLSVSYNVSKKISVRTGVHRVDYGYNTNDIAFSSSLSTSRGGNLSNIDLDPKSQNIVLQSAANGAMNNMEAAPLNPTSDVFQAFDPALNGRIVQQLGYLEVPLEVNYALVDNKWGVNVIGGVSSLFLIDNAISLESEGLITEIGKANNLNMVNFSTNIGLGVHYRFSPKVQWNVEPIFKYQLNTFSGATGNFQPFSLGVYSGFSFKF